MSTEISSLYFSCSAIPIAVIGLTTVIIVKVYTEYIFKCQLVYVLILQEFCPIFRLITFSTLDFFDGLIIDLIVALDLVHEKVMIYSEPLIDNNSVCFANLLYLVRYFKSFIKVFLLQDATSRIMKNTNWIWLDF